MKFFNKEIERIQNFGFKIEIMRILAKVFSTSVMPKKIQICINNKKHKVIKKWLLEHYRIVIKEYETKPLYKTKELKKNCIWIFWWQGMENAPKIVKKAVCSIKKYANGKEVIIINEKNYKNYVAISDTIVQKLESGTITKTFFSDILRMNLLSQYGGIWVDATIFMTDFFFEEFDNKDFFTLKLNENDLNNAKMVSKGKWCGFFIGGIPNKLFYFARDFFNEYMKNENKLVDYFLIDYIIAIAYDSFEDVKKMIDDVKMNNQNVFELQGLMNEPYNEKTYTNLLKYNQVHKLSYKEPLIEKVQNEKITFYGRLIIHG